MLLFVLCIQHRERQWLCRLARTVQIFVRVWLRHTLSSATSATRSFLIVIRWGSIFVRKIQRTNHRMKARSSTIRMKWRPIRIGESLGYWSSWPNNSSFADSSLFCTNLYIDFYLLELELFFFGDHLYLMPVGFYTDSGSIWLIYKIRFL